MHKLTLDPATHFGWCLLLDDSHLPKEEQRPVGQRLSYGTWDLTKDEDGNKCTRRGQYAWNLWHCFNALMRRHEVEGEDVQIILEGESYGSQKSEAGRRMAAMWLSVLEMMCERKGLPYPTVAPIDSWRMYFIDCTMAPKEVGAGLKDAQRAEERRKWLKARVMAECKKRNLKPQNDNEADALGIMYWSLRGGAEELERKRAEKKAKTAANRAQKNLFQRAA